MLLSELASKIGLEFSGSDFNVASFATLKEATSQNIVYFDNPKLLNDLAQTKAEQLLFLQNLKSMRQNLPNYF